MHFRDSFGFQTCSLQCRPRTVSNSVSLHGPATCYSSALSFQDFLPCSTYWGSLPRGSQRSGPPHPSIRGRWAISCVQVKRHCYCQIVWNWKRHGALTMALRTNNSEMKTESWIKAYSKAQWRSRQMQRNRCPRCTWGNFLYLVCSLSKNCTNTGAQIEQRFGLISETHVDRRWLEKAVGELCMACTCSVMQW